MSRLLQRSLLLALTAPGVLLVGPVNAAQAAAGTTIKPATLQTAWFWQTAAEQANPPLAPPEPPPTEPSGVPEGDLAVAHTSNDSSSSKMSVIAFTVDALKTGATVQDFTFSVTLDNGTGTANINASGAAIVACLPTRLWSPVEGGDYTDQPPVNCEDKVAAKIDGDTFTFAIPEIAQSWVDDQNLGVALVNDPDNTHLPFQAAFAVKSIKATMTFSPAVTTTSTGSTGSTGTSSGTPSTGTTSGGTGSAPSSVTPPASVDIPSTAPTTTTNPGTSAPPVVAPSTTTPTPVAHTLKPASSMPSGAFWVAAIAIALLVVVAGAVLADNAVPVPTATTSRLGRALKERERVRQQQQQTEQLATLAPQRV